MQPEKKDKVLLIIPAYNEEKNIAGVINDLRAHNPFYDILVVDDGSSDKMTAVLDRLKAAYIAAPVNLGYGAALQLGYKYAVLYNYDTVIQFDGDGQHNASDIIGLYQTYVSKQADIVIGSRFLDNKDTSTTFFRTLGNKLLSAVLLKFTKKRLFDITSGFQVLRRGVFEYYSQTGHFPDDYPDIDVLAEMLIRGNKIVEKPITINKRLSGTSMHAGPYFILYFFKTLLSLVMIVIRHKANIEA